MELTDDIFKQFRTFLKANNLYKDFMDCFRSQTYYNGRFTVILPREAIPNYISVMKNYNGHASSYAEYGAMVLTFATFNWCNDIETKPPLEFTRRWCTVGVKWGLYCRANNIEICRDEELSRLIRYWNEDKKWIDPYMLDSNELQTLKNDFNVECIWGLYIDDAFLK
jgi:hypothetical protein